MTVKELIDKLKESSIKTKIFSLKILIMEN